MNQPSGDRYHYKYSGGLATYPQQHIPIAIYSKKEHKTFFCYGGTVEGKRELLHMVSYFDHATGKVPRPTVLINKQTEDAHDNPVLSIDDAGHIWIFSNAHGTARRSYIHRSKKPYSLDAFEQVVETNFSYSQPWHMAGKGFLFLHTLYRDGGRSLFYQTSGDGARWSEPRLLARIERGHYQASARAGSRVGTAFNFHPKPVGLNARTNLYYLETRDMGRSWRTIDGKRVSPPLSKPDNAALVRDFQTEGKLVYLKDMVFTPDGRPLIVFLNSQGFESGPKSAPRVLHTAWWNGADWEIRPITGTDHNYDYGSIYAEPGGVWRFIGPTDPGPQPWGTGGEVAMWVSRNRGQSWTKVKQLTRGSRFNHTYVRRPENAHPDFYALWADGDAFAPSESRLYFTNQTGTQVWQLPSKMEKEFAVPVPVGQTGAAR
ncbi:MAG: hypothetical protein GY953_47655, partial [bacterium]|nr:hypothetical protein [bacterium]